MNMAKLIVVALAIALAGCASSVKREGQPVAGTPGGKATAVSVSDVDVALSPAAQKLLADNIKFNQDELLATVRRAIQARGLMKADAKAKAHIVVTDFRVRSSFSAVMFGIMAGTDSVDGDVLVDNGNGKPQKFTISASYGLGGLAGGQDQTRMSWLYEKFAELTVAELAGERKE